MALNNGFRSVASKLLNSGPPSFSKSAYRGIHSTVVTKMGGGHGHGEPAYLHAKHMYNLDKMKNQKLTATLSVITAVGIGVVVPIYAVNFQQKKTASG